MLFFIAVAFVICNSVIAAGEYTTIVTVAGNGTVGTLGDGGPAIRYQTDSISFY
jgi:hypothetical protein